MTEARVPASVVLSLGVHVAGLAAFGFLVHSAPKAVIEKVAGVDIIVNQPKAVPRPPRAKAPLPKDMSLFKMMALPHIPPPAPAAVPLAAPVIPPPEHKITMAEPPKLQEAKPKALPNLPTINLDASHHIEAPAKLDVSMTPTHAVQALASMPVLADVGSRRAAPAAIALDLARQQVQQQVGLSNVQIAPVSHHDALQAMAVLQDASSHRPAAAAGGIPDFGNFAAGGLQDAHQARPAAPIAPVAVAPAPKPVARTLAAAPIAAKKVLQIEGPLSGRQVVASSVPPFPAWARDQGILEADVAIRFTVDEAGNVMPGAAVEHTSSYGRIDSLALAALQNWRFAPAPGAGVQWGVITFKFVLE
ncbi:MAG: TonB family protein [Elusimicrobiota bacterium]